MKCGDCDIRRGSAKRSGNQPGSTIFIDGLKLLLARAELHILQTGRYTSNAEFDTALGDLGSLFDKAFRSLVPWFVHYEFSRNPS